MNAWGYLFGAIVCEVFGTSLLRDTEGFTKLAPTAVVMAAYTAAMWLLSLASRDLPIGVVYTVWAGLGTVMIFAIAAARFGEMPGLPVIVGAFLVVGGVALMSFGSVVPVE